VASGFAGYHYVVALRARVSTRVRPLEGLWDRTAASIGRTMSAIVVAAFVVAVALFAWRPVDGRDYVLVLRSTAILLVVWLGWATLGVGLLRRSVLVGCAATGAVWSAFRAAGVDAGAEIVRTYQSLFAALDRGINPYACDCIVHLVEHDAVRFGAFNYPPVEIWPYRLVEQVSGTAGVGLLIGTWLALNLAAFAILAVATRRSLGWRIIAFFPFLVLWELQTNIATTMVVVAGIVAVHLAERRAPRVWHRPVLWLLMGLGLLTKFVVVPLYGVWWLFRVRALMDRPVPANRRTAFTSALRSSLLDLVAPVAIAVTLALPFGISNVLRETVLFNLQLGNRDELTTFYPNVLSGALEWVGIPWLYPALAVAALAVSALTALRMGPMTSMFIVTIVFLLVAPTPEPQYTPIVVMLLVAVIALQEPVVQPVSLAAAPSAPPQLAAVKLPPAVGSGSSQHAPSTESPSPVPDSERAAGELGI
jgi:hypothetical protein